jgi:RNA polymerase sigma factor (sigma-70 family)
VTDDRSVEDLLRDLAPQVLGALVRRHGQFDACEDAVQEALLAAAVQWPRDGVPRHPRPWLLTVAGRSLVDGWRSDSARRRREESLAATRPGPASGAASDTGAGPSGDGEPAGAADDDTLSLLFLCCHPSLSASSQLALTLRAVGGLTTAEIAAAFLVPETTMRQRISRAKQRIRDAGARFEPVRGDDARLRLPVVLQVLYLVFNEGYAGTSGPVLNRCDLTAEAIRLARLLHRLLPDDGEAAGLLALMLLTDARRAARSEADGSLVPLDEQDRGRWDRAAIAEGLALVTRTLGAGPVGPYQVQAAIAALHDEAASAGATDWPQILALYEVLEQVAPGPVVRLSRAVALARVHGPAAGLALLGTLDGDGRMAQSHRLDAVRAHLLEQAGDLVAARECYLRAARSTSSTPEQRYLAVRAARLAGSP